MEHTELMRRHVSTADEFIIAYSYLIEQQSYFTGVPTFFVIGHAIELYIKASYIKIYGEEMGQNPVHKKNLNTHNLPRMFNMCCKDRNFANTIGEFTYLQKSTSIKNVLGEYDNLCNTLGINFIKYQELFIIFVHIQDIKYFGVTLHTHTGPYSYSMGFTPICANFLRNLNNFLSTTTEKKYLCKITEELALIKTINPTSKSQIQFLETVLSSTKQN